MEEQGQNALHAILQRQTTNIIGQLRKHVQHLAQKAVSCQQFQIQFVQHATQAAKVVPEELPTQTVTVVPLLGPLRITTQKPKHAQRHVQMVLMLQTPL